MNTNIQIFTSEVFGDIRTMTDEQGEPLFVGKDVALALGYKNVNKALADHVDEDDLTKRYPIVDNLGRQQLAIFINESGLYSLILASKLPQAKAFKRWVTGEVLPQIRKTGGYIPTKDADGRPLTEDEIMMRANEIVGRTLGLLNGQNEDCLTATRVAALWGMEVQSFNNLLSGMGIQYRKGGRWHLTEDLQDRGLAEERYFFCYSLKGKPRMKRYLVWTPEGVDFLNLAVRKLPRKVSADVQLNFNF
ncbi:MAG: phage antirepressor KilAC domain-containing protein [Bacteroidaceae bacterium]|nr:phage antirepressor KilAC domain-containing protein [Bacteroidaceae bacterium]